MMREFRWEMKKYWKKSGKSLKKVLTKGNRYGIITELSERDGLKNWDEDERRIG